MEGRGTSSMLDERAREALRIIVREHVRSGQPVASSHVARLHPEQVSSATIRNLMAELTEEGYLEQPHTSAGRVPTDLGYRETVDEVLTRRGRVPAGEVRKIEDLLLSSREIDEVLARAGKLLAEMTHQVGVVVAPDLAQAILEYVDFVRIAPRRLVAIFVSRSGVVTHRVVEPEDDLDQEQLDRLARQLREEFAGVTLPELRRRLIERFREDQRWAETLGRSAAESVITFLEQPFPEEESEVIVEGTSRLLDVPELADVERLREVLRALEERARLLRLLDRCLRSSGVQVMIGAENADPDLAPISVVASPYRAGRHMKGLVGVIGPRRMEYARAVALVDRFARTLSGALAGSDGDGEEQ